MTETKAMFLWEVDIEPRLVCRWCPRWLTRFIAA